MKQSMKQPPNLVVAFLAVLITIMPVAAQSNSASRPNPQDDKGFTSYAEFGGSSDSDGRVFELDSSIGYNFTKHFGMDMGVPIYFVQASSSTTGGSTSNNGLGNPHLPRRGATPTTAQRCFRNSQLAKHYYCGGLR